MATQDDRLIIKQAREKSNEDDPTGALLLDDEQDFTEETLICIGDLIKKHKADVQPASDFLSPLPGSIEVVDDTAHATEEQLDADGGQLTPTFDKSTEKSNDFSLDTPALTLGRFLNSDPDFLKNYEPGGPLSVTGQTITDDPATPKKPIDAAFIQQLSEELLSHNRFTPNSGGAFLEGKVDERDFDSKSGAMMQDLLGIHKRDGVQASYEQLAKIGSRLMHRAVGIDVEDPDTIDSDYVAGVITSIFTAQGGITKLDPKSVQVNDLKGFENLKTLPLQGEVTAEDFDSNLYGINPTMNTDILPFGGFAPVGMIFLALALTTSLSLVLKGVFQLISWGGSADHLVVSHMPGRFVDRANEIGFGVLSLADIGIRDTNHNFAACVDRGIDVFFGLIDTSEPTSTSKVTSTIGTAAGALESAKMTGKTFAKVARSPGYYAIVCRQILKSGNSLAQQSIDVFDDVSPGTAFQDFLDFSDHLKSSKIIAALNLFAGLGDIALRMENINKDSNVGLGQLGDFLTSDDGIVSFADNNLEFTKKNVGLTRVAKGRVDGKRANGFLSKDGRRQTISTSLIPSALLMPQTLSKVREITGDKLLTDVSIHQLHKLDSADAIELRTMISNRSGRIDADIANKIEEQLESEYMPFYFRDMRTNEIIAFHAFLKSLNDNYSVKYEETNAYGRVDPVMTYSNTRRSISMQFIIAAMGPRDYDEMWLKINKLVTLIYPQWSNGRQVQLGKQGKFIQPFSQVPSASPLIRIRLGDLFKSNYSQFALARLFGAGTNQFTIGEQSVKTAPQPNDSPPTSGLAKIHGLAGRAEFDYGAKVLYTPSMFTGPGDASNVGGHKHAIITGLRSPLTNKYQIKLLESDLEIDVPPSELAEITVTKGLEIPQKPKPAAVSQVQKQKEFFSTKENSIFRAFEENKGKGLAGVITSLNFDWLDAVWEINEGSKAPQWCAVNIEFQPIHDIAPGIAADGSNRAPVYNVGQIMKGLS